ncbi:MAG TPA: GTP-binding protein [Thermosulfidibacter takaii]|uniref:GTP-binding protein n=1 Tax=Thermosulfidibacter takaii TaxID=412593 RepID=A0A7C0U662_9BACT|nr:GTP-binding protein [Thermosulfidibacter takaii]
MTDDSLKFVIVGHVDHGKSTLIGRLLYDTSSLPEEKFEEIRATSEILGKEVEFAFLMDALKEERERGITIDTAQIFFRTPERTYVIIDAPGHKEFIKNMITGASQAEAAVLIVDADEGVREQTKRHGYLLSMLGLRQVCVVINKMDLVCYSRERFEEVKGDIAAYLSDLGIFPSFVIPISALRGDNVASPSPNLKWYSGPTVLEALGTFEGIKIEKRPFRFPVQDVYQVDGKSILVGRVESGEVKRGQKVVVTGKGEETSVVSIEKFLVENPEKAQYGESIGLCLKRQEGIGRGDVIASEPLPRATDTLRGSIFWMENLPYRKGDKVAFRCVTQEADGEIEEILRKYDPASMEKKEEGAQEILPAEVAEVVIKLDHPVLVDPFSFIPEMGRFVIEVGGIPVAGGIVSEG